LPILFCNLVKYAVIVTSLFLPVGFFCIGGFYFCWDCGELDCCLLVLWVILFLVSSLFRSWFCWWWRVSVDVLVFSVFGGESLI